MLRVIFIFIGYVIVIVKFLEVFENIYINEYKSLNFLVIKNM